MNFAVGRVENNVGKGENAGYLNLFPQCLQLCGKELMHLCNVQHQVWFVIE